MTLPLRHEADSLLLPLAKGSLVPAATDVLLRRIVAGEFAADPSSFPKEADLVAQYGVSRTVIRECLRILEEKGLVRIHQGRGSIALGAESWNIFDPSIVRAMIENDPRLGVVGDLYELRAAVEAEMARRAASHMTDEERADLGRALEAMRASLDDARQYVVLDRSFHDVIMDASSNRFGKRVVYDVFSWTREVFARSTGHDPDNVASERLLLSFEAHERIHRLIVEGRSREAGAEMRAHVLDSWAMTREAVLARG